ncbi:MAG: iron ABC transporter permease [Candidatus Promineifilaceae bacterium]
MTTHSQTTNEVIWPQLGIRPLLLLSLLLVLVIIGALSLALGSVSIPLKEVVTILLGGEPTKATWATIVMNFRLPKAFTAVLAGSALAVSGLQMQTLFRNPLAGPFVLGINSGASLGVALVVLSAGTVTSGFLAALGTLGNFGVIVAASLGSALVLFAVMAVAHRVNNTTLLILGLLFGYATSAVVSILLYFAIAERIQAYIAWTFGSFAGVTWGQLQMLAPAILLALVTAWFSTKPLNALLLGEAYAQSLGLNVRRSRFLILMSASILAGTTTAFCGPIAFIGVAVPHLCRSLFNSSDHRVLVPATIIMGGIVALTADLIAQLPGSQSTLPLNAVTALIGAPVVAWVILRRRNLKATFG